MSSSNSKPAAARRGFLRAVGLSGAAAAAAIVPARAQAQAKESRAEREKPRYKPNSPDVQAFYRTNRY